MAPLLAAAALSLLALSSASRAVAHGRGVGAAVGALPSGQTADGGDNTLNCRFGVGQVHSPVTAYDIAPLNLGWYTNWRADAAPARPCGIEYVQMLRVSDGAVLGRREHPDPPTYPPASEALATIVAANPGSLWLVGNEPDCIWQDNVLPQNYAIDYHEAYAAIKALDPSATVSAGGIVQPTPLRLQYLDAVAGAVTSLRGAPPTRGSSTPSMTPTT